MSSCPPFCVAMFQLLTSDSMGEQVTMCVQDELWPQSNLPTLLLMCAMKEEDGFLGARRSHTSRVPACAEATRTGAELFTRTCVCPLLLLLKTATTWRASRLSCRRVSAVLQP